MGERRYVGKRQHVAALAMSIVIGIVGFYSTDSEVWFEPVALVVGFHYGLTFVHALETDWDYDRYAAIGFGIWVISIALTIPLFQIYVDRASFFIGVIAMGGGYLTGLMLHYR